MFAPFSSTYLALQGTSLLRFQHISTMALIPTQGKVSLNGEQMPLVFFVNGKKVVDIDPDPECTLLTYLRETLRLCGTKLGCGEGGCGACTVMISRMTDRSQKTIKHLAVNACLIPVCAVHGLSVTTVEGIGSTRTKLHPVQERIAKAHGSQCGFCTHGIVMSRYALLRSSAKKPTMRDMEVAFQGNLCRCTGYRPIIEGYRTFTQDGGGSCGMGSKCCKLIAGISGPSLRNDQTDDKLFDANSFAPYDPSQEPIFPPELAVSGQLDSRSIVFKGKSTRWFRPTCLDEILAIKCNYPNAKIIVGNTEVGVEVKFKHCRYPVLVMPTQIPEMTAIQVTESGVTVGASVTLMDMQIELQTQIDTLPEEQSRLFKAIVDMLHFFGGKQIRNVASIGGNIMTGSPISDMIPIFTAAGLRLNVSSYRRGFRHVHMGEGFFTGYRSNVLEPDEILISIYIPRTSIEQYFLAYKQAKRRDDDIAIVNMALSVTFEPHTDVVTEMHVAFGGMGPTVVLVPRSCAQIIGKNWNRHAVETFNASLISELPLDPSASGGMILYRRSLTLSLFFKAFLQISQSLERYVVDRHAIPDREKSGAQLFTSLTPKSNQIFQKLPGPNEQIHALQQPKVHSSAFKHATGEAVYIDDIPRLENELYLALVLSTRAHANIISIDASAALKTPGVHAFFSAKDLTAEQNIAGAVVQDEEVFVSSVVTSHGQPIGAIVADNKSIAQRAAKLVRIEYEDILPILVTIEEAIAHKSFFNHSPRQIQCGDIAVGFAASDVIVEGECRMGGQEHFYMETHVTLAMPRDSDEIEIFSSSQDLAQVQNTAARVLSIPSSRVVVRVKRLGGGFGGKETRGLLLSMPVVIAAHRLQRPVRCMLDRHEDMAMTGTRHPFYFKYKAGASRNGQLMALDMEMYNNGGYSTDYSIAVLEKALHHCTNSYNIPNLRVRGWVCRTNLPSNTSFRGFGGPQAMFAAENMIRHLAQKLNMSEIDIIKINLYENADRTHYNQLMENCNLRRCWEDCLQQSNYHRRLTQVDHFNRLNRWRKRGITVVPTTFGIGFEIQFLNQNGALVHVYTDGSVLVSHGGTEMGQGLHIKMIQVASKALNIPFEMIHISETATDKVPNAISTAASLGSDLNGMAILNACKVILDRLAAYRQQYPDDGWKGWITRAFFDRVSLSATGFYKTPDIGHNFESNTGMLLNYFTFGAACSEVEIDCLTGDHQVIRTDIVMDLGESLNPAIDIGQVEGAFMQGYGLFTLEEMLYSPAGAVLSRGPGAYKIPGFADIPAELNVSLLRGTSNPRAVYSSKAVGEPPLFLASSVFFAIKNAIREARKEAHLEGHFALVSPASSERIRVACLDEIIQKFDAPVSGSFTPWNVMP